MAENDDTTHLNTEEARAGSTPGVTRYVLGFGLVLVILVFLLIYWLH